MILIAIDPDLRKSGYATYCTEQQRLLQVTTLRLWELFDALQEICLSPENVHVLLEYSTSKKVWRQGGIQAAVNVGKNKGIQEVLKDFLQLNKYKHTLVEPAGYSHYYYFQGRFLEQQFKKDHLWTEKTCNDSRAAVGMIWAYKNRFKHN